MFHRHKHCFRCESMRESRLGKVLGDETKRRPFSPLCPSHMPHCQRYRSCIYITCQSVRNEAKLCQSGKQNDSPTLFHCTRSDQAPQCIVIDNTSSSADYIKFFLSKVQKSVIFSRTQMDPCYCSKTLDRNLRKCRSWMDARGNQPRSCRAG